MNHPRIPTYHELRQQRINAFIADFDDEELELLKPTALAQIPPEHHERLSRQSVRDNGWLKTALYEAMVERKQPLPRAARAGAA